MLIFFIGFHGVYGQLGFTVANELALKEMLLVNQSGINSVRPFQVTLVRVDFNLISLNNVVSGLGHYRQEAELNCFVHTSTQSWRGYVIIAVCLCVSVCQ